MAHNLMRNQMAFVGETPWHGLGRRVEPTTDSATMLKAAGLDWTVEKIPGQGARVLRHRAGRPIYERYFVTRSLQEGETTPPVLGIVKDSYELVQNHEAFAFFEPFLAAGHAQYEAAGALGNGERIWVQVRLATPVVVAEDDEVTKFLLLSNAHDGSGALSIRFTPVRVVCQNTLNLAAKGGERVVNMRHSRHVRDRLGDEQVAILLKLVSDTFAQMAVDFARLARTEATAERRRRFMDDLFPMKSGPMGEPPLWQQRIDEVLDNDAVTPPKTRNTMWGLYNAVTHAEDYRKSTEVGPEARLDRVWFGRGADLKMKALNRALEHCA